MTGVLHTGLILFSVVVVCETEPTHIGTDRVGDSHGQSKLVHLSSRWALVLVNESLDFSRAESSCRSQFSSLATLDHLEVREGTLELLRQVGHQSHVWINNPSKLPSKPLPLYKQYLQFSALNFPKTSREGFARINRPFPALSSVSVCIRIQWDPEWNEVSTIFSYAARVFTNEFLLRGQGDMQGRVLLALIVHGKHLPYKAYFTNDGGWHHICVTWSSSLWAIYVDGERKDMGSGSDTLRDIHADGILILGQDQDSFGGNFTEPFFGNITDLNVWNISLESRHIRALNGCAAMNQVMLFRWNLDHLINHPAVKEIQALLFCPEKHQQMALQGCRTLQIQTDQHPVMSLLDCAEPLPFICMSSRERYLKIKQINDSQSAQPTAFMNHLMKLSNNSQAVLGQQSSGLSSLAEASTLLDVSVQALQDTRQEGLQPTDMVSLIQLLSLAADVPPQLSDSTNHTKESAQELSQHFISVADSIISQDNAFKWQVIKEVVNGPMDVVKSIDRMVTNLSPRLMAERDHLTFHSPNIKLAVQQQRLQESSSKGISFCGPETEKQSTSDCISVPHQKIQDLLNKGFHKLTLVNTWYGSLRPLFNPEENISMVPTVTDGSQRYLGTILGSSVISTTVLGDNQHVSTAVHFQLRHKVQNPAGAVYDPVCAFWDFNLTPEAGGWWNTKGCEVVSKQYGYTVCYCNHTTNFALLLQVYEAQPSPENKKALQVLTFIGCGVSLCGLLFTLILFIAVGVPKSDRTTVHKNLIVALSTAELLLMCSDWASANEAACFVVTALLHLFFMASFSWMLVEGLLLWSKVVSVNISEDRRMKLYYIIGWGLPVLIVVVTLAATVNEYKADGHCWLNLKTGTIWSFVGPVIFVLAVNSVVLCRVVMVTVSSARRRAKMLSPSSASKMPTFDLTWAVTRPVLILLPVLGLTWLCGVLVHLSVVIAYIFSALNAFQNPARVVGLSGDPKKDQRKERKVKSSTDQTSPTRPPTRVLHQPQRHLNSNKSGRPQGPKGETEER
ncbi:adhesion G protein-coupled receptor D2 isoform X4 [Vanacampus margaritifer]